MSNANIIGRMELALDRYELGELQASEVEGAIEANMDALERIGMKEVSEARTLCVRLVSADLATPPLEIGGQVITFEGDEPVEGVLRDFRAFLAQLPR